MKGSRFWEFYLVRYLLGTIFGVIILFFLVINYNKELTNRFFFHVDHPQSIMEHIESLLYDTTYSINKSDANIIAKLFNEKSEGFIPDLTVKNDVVQVKQSGFPILAAIIIAISGFLYMYFSSMIILVIHGLRFVVFERLRLIILTVKKQKALQSYSLSKCVIIFLLGAFILILISKLISSSIPDMLFNHIFSIMLLISLWVISFKRGSYIKASYEGISSFRASSKDNKFGEAREQYIESYRHLREHGNAFGIIACEILFAFWLIKWDFSFWAIFYWSLFGFTAWILGTYLEVFRKSDT
ncbi:hypothetical protein DFQ01_11430 [Paenibacillus cellulosilyticus]|uniref:Uncharacterized protein n=1 Tax=Paenibacillus cellulosilyticus TaxID=375489 RepID=A0A2V2YZR5_9BACL|nr:hypothetical protein [Paenibacillus cellulosilyticus]PWV99454.1 hypothetical protein DFQ01_11430 [Paenibacillus cellulosilyticus]QKS44712.1 hypothetical protein HUB94_10045 [Paenibacillus cellulosilyticus]